jgi:hypothetical protein
MSNPFAGIITAELKTLHKNMIDALLEDDALTVRCVLHYASKFTDCPNCRINNVLGKSANIYVAGGPVPFSHGICPYCQSKGKIQEPQNETFYLMPIWESKGWYNVPTENIDVQTMSKITTFDNIKRATSITIDSTIQRFGVSDFVKVGAPEPLGFGASTFIICSWKRT